MRVSFLGDSLTFGYGVSPRNRWVQLAAQSLGLERTNHSCVGDTTGGMLVRLYTEVLPQNPRIVFFMGGFNDLAAGEDPAIPRANTMAITQAVAAKGMVPLIGITPPTRPDEITNSWRDLTDMRRVEEEMEEFCCWTRHYAEVFGFPVIDFRTAMQACPERYGYLDGTHPDEAGQRIMAEIFCREFSSCFPSGKM